MGAGNAGGVRPRRRGPGTGVGLNLTAMIDVTFLLLVYFMVATEFKRGEEVYRLDLPRSVQSNRALDPFALPEEPLVVRVASRGPEDVVLRLSAPYPSPSDFEDLHRFLREAKIAEGVPGGLFANDHPIVIEPTRSTRWEHAIGAFNAAVRARYTNVTFAPPA